MYRVQNTKYIKILLAYVQIDNTHKRSRKNGQIDPLRQQPSELTQVEPGL